MAEVPNGARFFGAVGDRFDPVVPWIEPAECPECDTKVRVIYRLDIVAHSVVTTEGAVTDARFYAQCGHDLGKDWAFYFYGEGSGEARSVPGKRSDS